MNVIEFGRRRRGKSTLAMHIARMKKANIVVFDPNNQFANGHIFTDTSEMESFLRSDGVASARTPVVIIYRPAGDVETHFDEFASVMWKYGNYTLIIDEAHNLQKPQSVNPWLNKFIRQAPTEADAPHTVNLIQCMHRPQDANGIVVSQATHLIFFRFTKERDLKVVENECGLDCATAVRDLQGREFVIYFVDDERFEVVDDTTSWYEEIRPAATVMEIKRPLTEQYSKTQYLQ
jgi:hypothetical protein